MVLRKSGSVCSRPELRAGTGGIVGRKRPASRRQTVLRYFHAGCVKITHFNSPNFRSIQQLSSESRLALTLLPYIHQAWDRVKRRDEKRMRTLLRRISTGLYFQ